MVNAIMLNLVEMHDRLHKNMKIYAKVDFSCSALKERFEEISDKKRKRLKYSNFWIKITPVFKGRIESRVSSFQYCWE